MVAECVGGALRAPLESAVPRGPCADETLCEARRVRKPDAVAIQRPVFPQTCPGVGAIRGVCATSRMRLAVPEASLCPQYPVRAPRFMLAWRLWVQNPPTTPITRT